MLNKSTYFFKNLPIRREVFCLYLFLIVFPGLAFSQAQLKFKDTKKSFGIVKKGEIVSIEFSFVNAGNEPLMISEAIAECSCTTVTFSHDPILPGEQGKLIISFDTKSVYDRQDRIVEVISNAKNASQKIRFKGVVLKN